MSERLAETTAQKQRTPRTRRRRKLIDDPRQPFRLRVGVAYRIVEDAQGQLIVRAVGRKKTVQCHEPAPIEQLLGHGYRSDKLYAARMRSVSEVANGSYDPGPE